MSGANTPRPAGITMHLRRLGLLVRAAFWRAHPGLPARPWRRQNEHPAAVRTAFGAWLDAQARDGAVSDALARRVTL